MQLQFMDEFASDYCRRLSPKVIGEEMVVKVTTNLTKESIIRAAILQHP